MLSSNGVDSCCVISSFVDVLDDVKKLRIFITPDSIKENPSFYERFKNDLPFIIVENNEDLIKEVCKYDGDIINGHTADQLFGMGKFCGDPEYEAIRDANIYDGIKISRDNLGIRINNDIGLLCEHIKEYSKLLNLNIKTYGELIHLLNFSLKWTVMSSHITFDVKSISPSRESVAFFANEDFSNLAYTHFEEIDNLKYSLSDPSNYKKPLKKFVRDVLDFDLSFKPKSRSWKFKSHTVMPKDYLWVKMEEGYCLYKRPKEIDYNLFSETVKNFFGR